MEPSGEYVGNFDYLLQHGADVNTADATRHLLWPIMGKHDVIHKTVSTYYVSVRGEEDRATATDNVHSKFLEAFRSE